MVSKLFEHPFDLCKVRLQTDEVGRFKGPIDCLYKTWKFEGVRGLYRVRSNLRIENLIIYLICRFFFLGAPSAGSGCDGGKCLLIPWLQLYMLSIPTYGRPQGVLPFDPSECDSRRWRGRSCQLPLVCFSCLLPDAYSPLTRRIEHPSNL